MTEQATATEFPNREKAKMVLAALPKTPPRASLDVFDNELHLNGDIGPDWAGGIGASEVTAGLKSIGNKHATLFLNSPGGMVDEGVAIYNAILDHKPGVTIVVNSLAASIASYILQAGSKRIVAANAMVMIHNPWSKVTGDSADMQRAAELLKRYGERLVSAYASRSGKTPQAIREIMAAETWYSGSEAVDAGFADSVKQSTAKVAARMSLDQAKALVEASRAGWRPKSQQQTEPPERFPQRDRAKSLAAKVAAKQVALWPIVPPLV